MKRQKVSIVATLKDGEVDQVRIVRPVRMPRKLLEAGVREAIAVGELELRRDTLKCRFCGCTQDNACFDEETGEGCHWIDIHVCSATKCRMAYALELLTLGRRILKGGK